MIKFEEINFIKNIKKKNSSQPELIRLTCHPLYEIKIKNKNQTFKRRTQQKRPKLNKKKR